MTYHFPKQILGSRILLTYKRTTYENLTTNLGKILRSFENRAPVHQCVVYCSARDISRQS